jgi:hypothetical protein
VFLSGEYSRQRKKRKSHRRNPKGKQHDCPPRPDSSQETAAERHADRQQAEREDPQPEDQRKLDWPATELIERGGPEINHS